MVYSLAGNITMTISKLRALFKLPGRLHTINNEVADFEVVLRQVGLIITERNVLTANAEQDALLGVLHRANDTLQQLKAILERLVKNCVGSGKFVARAKAWYIEKPRIQALQEELHVIKAV